MKSVLQIKDVTKTFGNSVILKNVSLEVMPGQIVGIIGRNGSGKSLLFKAICNLINIDSGEILIEGNLHDSDGALDGVGALIEVPAFLPNISGLSNLKLLASLRNRISINHIKETMSLVGLNPEDKQKYKKYSLGAKQKLSIAAAIMENPDILILDEPFNNLDTQSVVNIRRLLKQLNTEKKATIVLCSHNPEDYSLLCSRIFKLEDGFLEAVK